LTLAQLQRAAAGHGKVVGSKQAATSSGASGLVADDQARGRLPGSCDFESIEPMTRRLLFARSTRARIHAVYVVTPQVAKLIAHDSADAPVQ
jgi:hypothetical protein